MKKIVGFLLMMIIVAVLGAFLINIIVAKPIQKAEQHQCEAVKQQAVVNPSFDKLPGQIVHHTYYTLGYSEKHEQALWVKYTLKKKQVGGKEPRSAKFYVDPLVKTGSADGDDYRRSGYDRGHLVPAADMSWNRKAMKESFYYSNMSPQAPSFNRGIWKELEEQVRRWAVKYDSVMVMAGPLFDTNEPAIGDDKVTVPSRYYKVLVVNVKGKTKGVGFILPNQKSNRSLKKYMKSIDAVEKQAGIDFFSELPDSIEPSVEDHFETAVWLR